MARSTMANLILRVRLLINDTLAVNAGQIFTDDDIQNVMDASRLNVTNGALEGRPTFSGTSIQYLDYFASMGDWEDSPVIKQYLTTVVTPSVSENIVGHWQFAASTYPPLFITGHSFDIFRSAADLLERWSAKLALQFAFSSDGQSFQRQQAPQALLTLASTYRRQQRPTVSTMYRSDLNNDAQLTSNNSLGARPLDYFASGNGS